MERTSTEVDRLVFKVLRESRVTGDSAGLYGALCACDPGLICLLYPLLDALLHSHGRGEVLRAHVPGTGLSVNDS